MQLRQLGISMRYQYSKPAAKSEMAIEAQLLVVKKSIYASIARICIESFLFSTHDLELRYMLIPLRLMRDQKNLEK
jgi:hypothetical protein